MENFVKNIPVFAVFVVKETNNFQGNFIFFLFKDWPSASTHFDYLSDKLWIPRQKNCFCFMANFSNFFEIAEVLLCKRVSHWWEEVIDGAKSKDYGRRRRVSHPSDFKVSFTSFDVWDRAMSCNKITLPCLLAHSDHFSINAWFKLIICWW